MAIDRGPWNALVDDDGSNLVGTVWNKDKIKTVILDPTDAAIAAIPASPPEVPSGGITGDVLTRDLTVPTFQSKWAAAAAGLPTGGSNNDVLTRDLTVPTFGSKWAPPAAAGVWVVVPFSAANFPNMPTIATGNILDNRYTVIGKTMFWTLQLFNAPATNIASLILVTPIDIASTLSPLSYAHDNNVLTTGHVTKRPAANEVGVFKSTFANWTGPTVSAYFTAICALP